MVKGRPIVALSYNLYYAKPCFFKINDLWQVKNLQIYKFIKTAVYK